MEARFREHPALGEAVEQYTLAILAVRESIAYAFKLLSKEERYRAFMIFSMMSVADTSGEGLSNSLFTGYCGQTAGISKRTAQSTLQLLVRYGFAGMGIDPSDRRSRRYKPTPQLFRFLEGWIEASLVALRRLDVPMAQTATARALMPALARSSSGPYARDGYVFFPDPDFRRLFAEIEGGSLVVMAVVLNGTGPTRSELARRFHMSRAQVTRIVAVGRESGLFGTDATGAATPTPRLVETYRDCILRALSFLAFHYENGSRNEREHVRAPSREMA